MNREELIEHYQTALFNLKLNLRQELNPHNQSRYKAEINVVTSTLEALRNPWVKTAVRLPEDHEMLNGCVLIVDECGYGSVQKRRVLERYPKDYPWWLPLPALPEKADGTPVIARRDYPQKPTSGLIEEDA